MLRLIRTASFGVAAVSARKGRLERRFQSRCLQETSAIEHGFYSVTLGRRCPTPSSSPFNRFPRPRRRSLNRSLLDPPRCHVQGKGNKRAHIRRRCGGEECVGETDGISAGPQNATGLTKLGWEGDETFVMQTQFPLRAGITVGGGFLLPSTPPHKPSSQSN